MTALVPVLQDSDGGFGVGLETGEGALEAWETSPFAREGFSIAILRPASIARPSGAKLFLQAACYYCNKARHVLVAIAGGASCVAQTSYAEASLCRPADLSYSTTIMP